MNVSAEEYKSLRSKILILEVQQKRGRHVKYLPKAFTEKGLYMLATILKSPQATLTTIAIVEAFAKFRELTRAIAEISATTEDCKQKTLLQKSGDLIADILGDDLKAVGSETSFELNLALLKVKHTVRREV